MHFQQYHLIFHLQTPHRIKTLKTQISTNTYKNHKDLYTMYFKPEKHVMENSLYSLV
jgi:hypothetical protein